MLDVDGPRKRGLTRLVAEVDVDDTSSLWTKMTLGIGTSEAARAVHERAAVGCATLAGRVWVAPSTV